jgi:hypothetical protein
MTYSCDTCADKIRRLHQLRIIEYFKSVEDATFVTVTSHEKMRGFAASKKCLQEGMAKLFERLRRKNGTRHYVLIHEAHPSDGVSLHAHMLYQGVIEETWLKDNARECGMGFMGKCEQLRDPASAGKYVSKYISKSLADDEIFPKRFKRVRYSVRFPQFDFEEKASDYTWDAYPKTKSDVSEIARWAHATHNEFKRLVLIDKVDI